MGMEPEDVVARASPVNRATGSEQALSDEELAEAALAADPDTGVAADAIPLDDVLGAETRLPGVDLLPDWYMPAPTGRSGLVQGWRRKTAFLIIASFIVVTAYGLCAAYLF